MTAPVSGDHAARPGRRLPVLVAAVAVLLVAGGAVLLARAGTGLAYRHLTVAGVPLTEVAPAVGPPPDGGSGAVPPNGGSRPGVVVAHGFAGSSRLMAPIADRLAREGFAVVLLDFTGHGAHRGRLPGAGGDSATGAAALAADLDTAVRHLRSLPGVDPARIGLVGHSMGAGVVTRYAVAHPEIAATVAISLPDVAALPARRQPPDGGPPSSDPRGAPRSMLLIVGGAEFAGFQAAVEEAVARSGGAADRRAVVVPGVEHISVLFAGRTLDETATWLAGALGPVGPSGQPHVPVGPLTRLAAAGLLLLAFGIGLYPLAVVLLGPGRRPVAATPRDLGLVRGYSRQSSLTTPRSRKRQPEGPAVAAARVVAVGRPLLAALVASVVAALATRALPTDRLPLAVGGHVTVFLAIVGLLLVGAVRLTRGRRTVWSSSHNNSTHFVVAGVLLAGYSALAVAVPLHLGFTSTVPVGDRWWLLPVVIAGCLAFFGGAERAVVGERAVVAEADQDTRGPGRGYAVICAATVVGLTGAALAGLAPGFVLLVVPLFAVLLAWQAAWAAVLRRLDAPPWLVALTGAVLLGWPVATTLPLTG